MDSKEAIKKAEKHFSGIVQEQLKRIERMKKEEEWTDYKSIKPVIIGVCFGDGIGKIISKHARHVLEHFLKD